MAKELIKGFDYNLKKDFLERYKNSKKSSIERIINVLNSVTMIENEHDLGIFELDENKVKDFIARISTTSINQAYYYISSYFQHYSEKTGKSNPNIVCRLLKSFDGKALSYQNEMKGFVTSFDELLQIFEKVNISNVDKLLTILSYMGMGPKDIAELKVGNLDLKKGELRYKAVIYSDIDERVMTIIKKNILNIDDESESLLKMQDNKTIGTEYVGSSLGNLKRKVTKKGLNKKVNSKNLSRAGMLAYYIGHKDEFELEDGAEKKRKMIMLYRVFGFMEKVSPGRFSTCNDEFELRLNIIKDNAVSKNKYFNAYTEVTNEELEMVTKYLNSANKSVNNNKEDFLESKRKSHIEKPKDGDEDDEDKWYEKQKEIGNKNENLVKQKLEKFNMISDIKSMKDFSGYDLRYTLNKETYRLEVKTLDKDLQFYISLNEINSIFDKQKKNYAIALVKDERISIIDDAEFIMKMSENFFYRLEDNECMEIVAYNFAIRLKSNFYYDLKSLEEFIGSSIT